MAVQYLPQCFLTHGIHYETNNVPQIVPEQVRTVKRTVRLNEQN